MAREPVVDRVDEEARRIESWCRSISSPAATVCLSLVDGLRRISRNHGMSWPVEALLAEAVLAMPPPEPYDTYTYGGTSFDMRARDCVQLLDAAKLQYEEHLEEVELQEVDGTGTIFCGCPECLERVMMGFWITTAVRWVRDGTIR